MDICGVPCLENGDSVCNLGFSMAPNWNGVVAGGGTDADKLGAEPPKAVLTLLLFGVKLSVGFWIFPKLKVGFSIAPKSNGDFLSVGPPVDDSGCVVVSFFSELLSSVGF